MASAPAAAQERAPHGGELRCSGSMCRRLAFPRIELPRLSLAETPSKTHRLISNRSGPETNRRAVTDKSFSLALPTPMPTRPLLERHPRLRVCLADFGAAGDWTPTSTTPGTPPRMSPTRAGSPRSWACSAPAPTRALGEPPDPSLLPSQATKARPHTRRTPIRKGPPGCGASGPAADAPASASSQPRLRCGGAASASSAG